MHTSILAKLEEISERYQELNALLSDPSVANDPEQLRQYGQEHAQLSPIVEQFNHYQTLKQELKDLQELASDPEMKELAEADLPKVKQSIEETTDRLQRLMLPKDPLDKADVYLEIRAGTGGDEAAIFAGDLWRMYAKFAENQGWQLEILSESAGEHGGYREIISRVSGQNVYSTLKYESGAHRVQRVPETESSGRIHTSAATVAVLPESDEVEQIEINPADIRVDTYRASGAGGQHINKTDSAVRITHIPTGVVVECQEERSQHKNRAKAMRWLQTKLYDAKVQAAQAEQAAERKSLVGSGDRSERIRTYNYPQSRVTDHRINLTLYQLDDILQGQLELLVKPLQQEQETNDLLALQTQ